MANEGNDQLLVRIAVFGVTFSIFATLALAVLVLDGGDYDYDTIHGYRDDLIEFSGESMINQNPWVLTHVYTPWELSDGVSAEHLDADNWLYGEEITSEDYDGGIGESANIRLSAEHKSSAPITIGSGEYEYTYADGYTWWADPDNPFSVITRPIGEFFGGDVNTYSTITATEFSFTGWRYVFDPTLPFAVSEGESTSSKDGSLSVVWYSYNGQEGLSGGLQVYGGDVLLSTYTATDIIAGYNNTSAYATTYEFNFNGTILTLSIRFDADVIENGTPLMEAFTAGKWTMAISSVSAGNFFDVKESASFAHTAGNMVDTFVDIYTFDLPQVQNPWAKTIMWLLVGLPMTLAMLCVTMRMVSAVRIF